MKVFNLGTISPNLYTNLYNKFEFFNIWVPYFAPFLARTNSIQIPLTIGLSY